LYFLQFAPFTKDLPDDMLERVMLVYGIDSKNKEARVNFDIYARLNCLLKFNNIESPELDRIWWKIINPGSLVAVDRADIYDFLERLARGKT
jgi:hypothetical protein